MCDENPNMKYYSLEDNIQSSSFINELDLSTVCSVDDQHESKQLLDTTLSTSYNIKSHPTTHQN